MKYLKQNMLLLYQTFHLTLKVLKTGATNSQDQNTEIKSQEMNSKINKNQVPSQVNVGHFRNWM